MLVRVARHRRYLAHAPRPRKPLFTLLTHYTAYILTYSPTYLLTHYYEATLLAEGVSPAQLERISEDSAGYAMMEALHICIYAYMPMHMHMHSYACICIAMHMHSYACICICICIAMHMPCPGTAVLLLF